MLRLEEVVLRDESGLKLEKEETGFNDEVGSSNNYSCSGSSSSRGI